MCWISRKICFNGTAERPRPRFCKVHFSGTESNLRSANVQSTKEVINLVVSGRKRKNLVYISTIGVFGGGQVEPDEYTDITQQSLFRMSGYSKSKWVCEVLLGQVREQKLASVTIVRPGLIGAHSVTGEGNVRDWLSWMVRAAQTLKLAPTSDALKSVFLRLVPVDYVAQTVTILSLSREVPSTPKECSSDVFFAYHLVNSDDAISYQEFFNCLKRVCPNLKETDYGTFRVTLREEAKKRDVPALFVANSLLPDTETSPFVGKLKIYTANHF